MRPDYFDHPAVDVLERFALRGCSEDECEAVETHMLACESCLCALENMELEIAATKLALAEVAAEEPQKTLAPEQRKSHTWKHWFSLPALSWAGAGLATCALCLFAFMPANVEIKADRGVAKTVVPAWRNAQLELIDEGLPAGALRAEVVNEVGAVVWSGTASGPQGDVKLRSLRFTRGGHYYARLYTADAEHDLLSEFPFEVKFPFQEMRRMGQHERWSTK
jgi:hypothetical protein